MTGYCKASLYLGESDYPHTFYVMKNDPVRTVDAIIGNDLIAKVGQVTIDPRERKRKLTFRDARSGFSHVFPIHAGRADRQ